MSNEAGDPSAADGIDEDVNHNPEAMMEGKAASCDISLPSSQSSPSVVDPNADLAVEGVDDDGGTPPATSDDEMIGDEYASSPAAASPQAPETRRAVVVPPPPLPLDWTRLNECDAAEEDNPPVAIVRYPWDVVDDISKNDDDALTLVGTAGQKITHMGADLHSRVSPNISSLVLRSHLIRTMEGIGCMDNLEILELYDNQVDELRELDVSSGNMGMNLRVLDISYNVIRDMAPLASCPNLVELYIAQNKIKSISGIRNLTRLRKIDLGANRIRVMDEDELSGLVNLEELWLGKNKIERITGLNSLSKLRRLDVQSNRLTRVEGLEGQVHTLEELYLSHNGINDEGASCPGGLSLMFENLNTIDMSRNRLTSTRPFGHLTSLVDLWISGNDIKTFDDVEDLRRLTNLDSVYLEYNPLDKEFEYRKRLAEMIPSLTQIDANKIGGLAAYGWGGIGGGGFGSMGDPAERMRQMQDMAIRRAELESQQNRYAEEKHAT